MKHGREYSQGKEAEKKNRKNHKEVCKILEYFERKLPSGWNMNEGEMKIRNQSDKVMLHTFCKAEDDLEKDTKWMDHEEEVMKTLEDINEHLDPGWKFSKVTVRKNGKILNILKIWKIWNLRMNKYTETGKREVTRRKVESRLGRKIDMVNYENNIAADEIFEYDFKS